MAIYGFKIDRFDLFSLRSCWSYEVTIGQLNTCCIMQPACNMNVLFSIRNVTRSSKSGFFCLASCSLSLSEPRPYYRRVQNQSKWWFHILVFINYLIGKLRIYDVKKSGKLSTFSLKLLYRVNCNPGRF